MAIVISGVNNNDKITSSDGTIDLLSGVNYVGVITAPAIQSSGNITASGNVSGVNITSSNNLTAANINVGSNIQFGNAGIITATTLIGNVTGNVNHTSNLLLQISGSEKLRIANSGAFGLNGTNYGSSGQVLTSQGSGSSPTWSTISGTTINNNADNRIITGSGTANTLNAETNVVIDSTGRLLVGTGHDTSRNVGDLTAKIQLEGAGYNQSSLSLMSNAGASAGNTPHITMGKSRGSSNGNNTIVADGDALGQFQFAGADGTDCNSVAASIIGRVDGTPGSNDMPGRLVFSTTSDGAASPTERMRIDKSGNVTVTNGNLVIGTNNKGIDFSATANATVMSEGFSTTAPTMDNELLKTYERGTWTGNIRGYDHAGGAGWGTVATTAGTNQATGRYIRIGNVVHCWIKFSGITWDTSWTYPSIVGVPFGHNHYDGAGGFCIAQDTNMFTDSTGTCMGNVMGSQGYTVGQRPNGQTNLTFDTSNGNRHMFASMTFYTSTGG